MQTDIPPSETPPSDAAGSGGPQSVRPGRRAILTGAVLLALALGSTALILELTADATPAGPAADADRIDPEAASGELPADTPLGDDPLVDPPTGVALCAVEYTPETLVAREVAFLGTVTSIDGDDVTFEVEEAFTGDLGGTVTLGGAEFLTTPTPDNVNPISVGGRYLVAGDDGFAWGCGFTHLYSEDVAASWREAFAG